MGGYMQSSGIFLVEKHAKAQNWIVRGVCEESGQVCLERGESTAIVQFGKLGKLSIATCITHPYLGKSVLFREGICYPTLKKVLEDPRAHTGRGKHKSIITYQKIWEKINSKN
jgi:hypothetical protein